MYKLGIDVGGTNTDAVLIDENLNIVADIKHPTSGDVYDGILGAVRAVLEQSGVDRTQIHQAMLGTTQCTNAIGSAISKVSGAYEKLIDYHEIPREQALEQAKTEAIDIAVEAGAIRETVEIIEVEDVPLAYYPGNTNRVKIKAAGDLRG